MRDSLRKVNKVFMCLGVIGSIAGAFLAIEILSDINSSYCVVTSLAILIGGFLSTFLFYFLIGTFCDVAEDVSEIRKNMQSKENKKVEIRNGNDNTYPVSSGIRVNIIKKDGKEYCVKCGREVLSKRNSCSFCGIKFTMK